MNVLKYLQAYHFFGLLWTNQFIQAIGMTTIAGAVCSWYTSACHFFAGCALLFVVFFVYIFNLYTLGG